LEEYYQLLKEYNPKLSSNISLNTSKGWFEWAVILQWTILVAYENVCRSVAMSESDEQRRADQLQYFRNVNWRALLAMKSVDDWDTILLSLEETTLEEKQEAKEFCDKTPIKI
jgi:hypothetical protein